MSELVSLFDGVEDSRASNVSHKLSDLLLIMVAATLCGQNTATDIALFAKLRKDTLNRIVDYDQPPSHDTISRVLRLVDPKAFAQAFARFMESFAKAVKAQGGADIVALDGKAMRRAYAKGSQAAPPLMVSAFDCRLRLCIAMEQVIPGTSEIDAALRIVDLLDLTGKIVTADALHCTHDTTKALTAQKADYVITLKKNRPAWFETANDSFDQAEEDGTLSSAIVQGGRGECKADVIRAPHPLCAGHKAFGRVITHHSGKQVIRLFMLSRVFEPAQLAKIVRAHWAIENNLHWVLDVHLNEDMIRARKDHAPTNIALMKRIARNILQTIDKSKTPISHRIKNCMWDEAYLINAITHMR